MKILAVKPELCTACGICEKVCSQTFFKEENPEKSAIRIEEKSPETGHYVITVCDQLGACVDVCPIKALLRNKKGVVIRNKKLCVGCYACMGFCPNLAMFTHPDHTEPFKCVACGKCVDGCPEGVLSIVEVPDLEPSETEKWAIRLKEVVA
jgi:carbon-monoxide dehydrogenase iron sulfur subunit